jgi:hypothetical protein
MRGWPKLEQWVKNIHYLKPVKLQINDLSHRIRGSLVSAYNLPLYALSLIFPQRSYIGTLWEIGDHIDLGEGCSEVFRFPTQTKITGEGPGGAGIGNAG